MNEDNNRENMHSDSSERVKVEFMMGDSDDRYHSRVDMPEMHASRSGSQGKGKEEGEANEAGEEQESGGYYCMTCNQNYDIKVSACRHKKQERIRYKCTYSQCHRSFQIESSFQRHKLIHEGIKPYQCDFQDCDQRFNQKSNLNRHKRVHTQEKPFICQTCCKAFTTTTNLKQHVQIHLQDRDRRKKYICEIKGCQKEYFYMCNLKKHKQEHEDPLGDCLVEKKPDLPVFGISIGNCNFKIAYQKSKEHSEVMITHAENVENSVMYDMELFQRVFKREDGDGDCLEELDNIVRKMFEATRNALNIGFQMHEELRPIAGELVKTFMSIVGETNLRVFTIIVPVYGMFHQMVNNLMSEFNPESDHNK